MARYTFNNQVQALQFIAEGGYTEATIYQDASGYTIAEIIVKEDEVDV